MADRTDAPNPNPADGDRWWLDDPRNVRKIAIALYILCGALLVIDPFIHKHGPFAIEHWWGFYGLYGFIGSVFLVLTAKELRKLLMRDEDYYDR